MAATVIILAILVVLVILAIRGAIKNPNPCDTCGGNSVSCHKAHWDQKLNQLWKETKGSASKAREHS